MKTIIGRKNAYNWQPRTPEELEHYKPTRDHSSFMAVTESWHIRQISARKFLILNDEEDWKLDNPGTTDYDDAETAPLF